MILLVLGILAAVLLGLLGRWASEQVEDMPDVMEEIETWVPDEQDASPDINDDGGAEVIDPDDSGDAVTPHDLGALFERFGDAVEGARETVSAMQVEDFDPRSVPADMLPTFYGFLMALARLSPEEARHWMTEEAAAGARLDEWEEAKEHHTHQRFINGHNVTHDDGTEDFVIVQVVEVRNSGEPMDIPWQIEFSKVGNRWLVTDFE